MDFLLSGTFARFDAWFLIANLAFLIAATVSYVVEKLFWLFRVVSPIKPNHSAQSAIQQPPASQPAEAKSPSAGAVQQTNGAPASKSVEEPAALREDPSEDESEAEE